MEKHPASICSLGKLFNHSMDCWRSRKNAETGEGITYNCAAHGVSTKDFKTGGP